MISGECGSVLGDFVGDPAAAGHALFSLASEFFGAHKIALPYPKMDERTGKPQ
jgi:hypothetical protein